MNLLGSSGVLRLPLAWNLVAGDLFRPLCGGVETCLITVAVKTIGSSGRGRLRSWQRQLAMKLLIYSCLTAMSMVP